MSEEMRKSVPRVKATPMQSNPDLMIGVGEKGGISIYGLQRFPVTLFWEQWEQLVDEEVIAELATFAEANKAQLSDGRATKTGLDKAEGYTINASDIAVIEAEAAKLQASGDVNGAIKFNTIKAVAQLNKNRVTPEQMLEIMTVKARK